MGKSYLFQELDAIYLAPANALVSDVSKIENVFDYVNGLYEAVLRNDKEAIDKVMCIMQARATITQDTFMQRETSILFMI